MKSEDGGVESEVCRPTIIFRQMSRLKMRSNTSLWGRGLLWIASEMLEILTKILKIILN